MREAATERDRRDRSAGELREHYRRIRIGGGRRLGRERACGKRCDPFNLLPQEPADLIDLVYAHVDCNPTGIGPERSRRRLLIPLHARQLVDLAKLTRLDSRAEFAQLWHEPPPITDLKHYTALRRRIARAGGLLG